jgi:hypothetical protein
MRIDGPQITGSFSIGETVFPDLSSLATTSSVNSLSSSVAITGSNLFKGNQTFSGSLIPAVNNTYDLGDSTHQYRHLYLSSGSLYIDGVKVLGSTSEELRITTDSGQSFKILEAGSDTITLQSNDGNITLATSGGGDVILDPTSGIIALKGTTTIYSGNRVLSSDGNAIQFGNSVTMTGSLIVTGYIETQELRTTYISSSILYRSGSTKFGDEISDTHAFTGSLLVSGSVSVPGSNLVSGSSQIIYSGLTDVPSGIISGSAQVDVMSTTNILRLATTGSNSFNGNQTLTGSIGINTSYDTLYGASIKRTAGSSGALRLIGNDNIVGNSGIHFYNDNTTSGSYISMYTNGGLNLNGVMSITGSNVGIGITPPSDLYSGFRSLQVGTGMIYGGSTSGGYVVLQSNAYYDGTNTKYIYSSYARSISCDSAGFTFNLAGTGTAGNTITWSTGMVLSPTNQLGVNTTPSYPLDVLTSSSGTFNTIAQFQNTDYTSGNRTYIRVRTWASAGGSYSSYFGTGQDGNLYMIANNSARGGDLVINAGTGLVTLNAGGLTLSGTASDTIQSSGSPFLYLSGGGSSYTTIQQGSSKMRWWQFNGSSWIKTWDIDYNGNATLTGTFTESSSIRYKENVETIKYGLDKVLQMRGVTYTRKDNGSVEAGVIAEEINEVTSLVVLKNEEGVIDSVSYGRINAYLIEAIKELKKEIEELKNK